MSTLQRQHFDFAAYMGTHSANTPSGPSESSSPTVAASTVAAAAVTSGVGRSSSFFARFGLPIRSRTRNLADFHIRPNEPHRNYSAGDLVRGAVILTVIKPIRITHLTVTLHGFVRVFKGPVVAEATTSPVLPTAGRVQYHGHGHVSLFQDEQVLSGEGRLEPGKYEFNFELVFPSKGLPSSIDVRKNPSSPHTIHIYTNNISHSTTLSPYHIFSCNM
jgi:arrestin-related trafficking adapter 9